MIDYPLPCQRNALSNLIFANRAIKTFSCFYYCLVIAVFETDNLVKRLNHLINVNLSNIGDELLQMLKLKLAWQNCLLNNLFKLFGQCF